MFAVFFVRVIEIFLVCYLLINIIADGYDWKGEPIDFGSFAFRCDCIITMEKLCVLL